MVAAGGTIDAALEGSLAPENRSFARRYFRFFLRRRLGLGQRRLQRECHTLGLDVDGKYLNLNFLALANYIVYAANVLVRQLGNVNQPFDPGSQFDECPEFGGA